jgi:hypothetical protein
VVIISAVASFFMIIFQLYIFIDQNSIISNSDIENYSQKYVKTYKDLTETYIHPDNRTYLEFYKDNPYKVRAIISTSHGAGLDFIPSKMGSSNLEITNKAIENYIFNGSVSDYNHFGVYFDYENATIINLGKGNSPAFVMHLDTSIKNIAIKSEGRPFIRVLENGSVLIQNILIGKIYYNYIIIKGSNRKKDWTEQIALDDALYYFKADLIDAFTESEDFRKYLAMPELSDIANKILERKKNGYYTNYLLYENDFQDLYETTKKYNIPNKFADDIYHFNEDQNEIPSWWEQYDLLGIIRDIVLAIIIIPSISFILSKSYSLLFGRRRNRIR